MKKKYFFILITIISNFCFSQSVDLFFNQNYNQPYQNSIGRLVNLGENGKIYSLYDKKITQWNPNGGIDDNSSMNSPVIDISFNYRITRGNNDKFLLYKNDSYVYETTIDGLLLFNSDGSQITSFDSPIISLSSSGGNSDTVYINEAILQSDGKIMLVGKFNYVNGISRNNIVRLNADGTVDLTFNPGTGVYGVINGLGMTSDGKYVIGGDFGTYNSQPAKRIARINNDGSFDNSFYTHHDVSNGFTNAIRMIKIFDNNQVLAIGTDYRIGTTNYSKGLVKLLSNGQRDTNFSYMTGNIVEGYSVLTLPDGKFIIDKFGGNLQRYNSNGSLDNTFSCNVLNAFGNYNYPMYRLANGKILVCKGVELSNGIVRNGAFRINSNGSIDYSFNPTQSVAKKITNLLVLADSKILCMSYGNSYNDIPCRKIFRLNIDGELDNTFNLQQELLINPDDFNFLSKHNFLELPSGKILVYAYDNQTIEITGNSPKKIVRLNNNGSLDNSFDNPLNSNLIIRDLAVTENGKILIIGNGSINVNGNSQTFSTLKIHSINDDGQFSDINNSPLANGEGDSFLKTKDGKLFLKVFHNGMYKYRKINSQGEIDNNFTSLSNSYPNALVMEYQSNSKYLIRTQGNIIVRVDSFGNVDNTFNQIQLNTLVYSNESIKLLTNSEGYIFVFTIDKLNVYDPNGNFIHTHNNVLENQSNSIIRQQNCDQVIIYGDLISQQNNYDIISIGDIKRVNLDAGIVPAPIGDYNQDFEIGETLADLDVIGENIQWYLNQNICQILPPPNSQDSPVPSSTILENGNTYYASQTIGGNESKIRLPITVTSTLNITQNSLNKIKFSPNPSKDYVYFENVEFEKIEVFNLNGINLTSMIEVDIYEKKLNISHLDFGVYILKVVNKQGNKFITKLIKI